MRRFTPPSLGFCLIVLTYLLTAGFFAWGLSTPPLDRVWQLHHQLKTGDLYALGRDDRELLEAAMARHPELAQALLSSGQIGIISAHRDGWIDTPEVSIVRTPRSLARSLVLDAARKRDRGEKVTLEAACAKLFASEMVGRVADRAVQIHGGAGYMADYAVERFYRDVRLFRLFEGTSQIQQLVIARETMAACA